MRLENKPFCELVKPHMLVMDVSLIIPGDIIYKEWYGDGGDESDPNRRHLYMVVGFHNGYLQLSGAPFSSKESDWLEKYSAIQGGSTSWTNKMKVQNTYSAAWLVGNDQKLLSQYLKGFTRWYPKPGNKAYDLG